MTSNGQSPGLIAEGWARYRAVALPALIARTPDIEPILRHAYYAGALQHWRSLAANPENLTALEDELTNFLNEVLKREGLR